MAGTCNHGFAAAECLICRTLGINAQPTATAEAPKNRRRDREAQPLPSEAPSPRGRLDMAGDFPSPARRRDHSLGGSLMLALMVLLAVGAAIWILVGVVFTFLHVLELVAVAAGAGWVGYRIGHFKGSRYPRTGE
ncbi:MAG TPA: hypothetical protein VNG12_12425 [Acidimicrobiales bacterium]|nr:hypothetical protein [Acidimicrobiales bacterium]